MILQIILVNYVHDIAFLYLQGVNIFLSNIDANDFNNGSTAG